MDRLIDQTQRILADMLGVRMRESRNWDEVVAALAAGVSDVIVEVAWQHPGEAPDRHELVLKRLNGDRIDFYNPKSHGVLAVGTVLPANPTVPERRVEGMGFESLPALSLRDLFVKGQGVALIPA